METQNGIDLRFAVFGGILLLTALSVSVACFFILYKRRLFKKQAELLWLEAQHKEDLLFSSITSAEMERQRIASDIHDELGSIFVILSCSINKIENKIGAPAMGETRDSRDLIEKGISSVRRISHSIMPPELDLYGLLFTLENFCRKLNNAGTGVSVDFNFCPDSFEVPKTIGLPLYRIVQELSSNTLKHAGATAIFLELLAENKQYVFNYSDNGKGLDLKEMNAGGGLGFKNIESRVSMVKGTLGYKTDPGNGFSCQIRIPNS